MQDFSEGLAAVEIQGKWGFIDGDGTVVIQPKFRSARHFSEGLALVQNDSGLWGYISRSGDWEIPPPSTNFPRYSTPFSRGLALIITGETDDIVSYCYMNREGGKAWCGWHRRYVGH